MPLWIGAYLADTMHLTRDQHGGYLLLLIAYWRNKGPLADDPEELATITKASPAEWKKLGPRLARFFEVGGGFWVHTRADKELASAGLRKAAAVAKARAGAEARWKKSPGNAPGDAPADPSANAPSDASSSAAGNAPSMPGAVLKQCPTPSPISSSLRSEDEPRRRAAPPPGLEEVPASLLDDWKRVRTAKRAGVLTETAVAGFLREAAKAGLTPAEAMRACCEFGWQGFNAEWYATRTAKKQPRAAQAVNRLQAAASTIFGAQAPVQEVIDV